MSRYRSYIYIFYIDVIDYTIMTVQELTAYRRKNKTRQMA